MSNNERRCASMASKRISLPSGPRAGRKLFAAIVLACLITGFAGSSVHADTFDPPWSQSTLSGTPFTVPGVDNASDFYGDVNRPDLTVFFAGNQYMVVNALLTAFKKSHPEYQRIFAETLPPGILVRQVRQGGLVMGNMRISLQPDIFAAGRGRIRALEKRGWFSATRDYARNHLAIMVYRGNPFHLTSWKDLARPGLRLCMPNPKTEGIARHAIIPALLHTGGAALERMIYHTKVSQGTTHLTRIHHRQTPLAIMRKQCDAGAVWSTEALFQSHIPDHPIAMVTLPEAQNHEVTYAAGLMRNAPHPVAARAFLRFLTSSEGQAIYRHYGFLKMKR